LHPDGLLVGVGANDDLRFIDLRSQAVAAFIPNKAHDGRALTGVAFSENGYITATSGEDGSACTWDLRKAAPNTEPLVRRFALPADAGGATALSFDLSGCYLAVGSATRAHPVRTRPCDAAGGADGKHPFERGRGCALRIAAERSAPQ
jgi:WD40 repeat protein